MHERKLDRGSRINAADEGTLERPLRPNLFYSPNNGLVGEPVTPSAAARSAAFVLRANVRNVRDIFLDGFVRPHCQDPPCSRFSPCWPGTSGKRVSSRVSAVAVMSSFFGIGSEDAPASCGRGDTGRRDRRWPSPRVSFQSLRATLIGSIPACRHHARSSRERCTTR